MKNKGVILFLFALFVFLVFFNINLISASSCNENWVCDSWSSCHNGERERDCRDINHCGTTNDKPNEIKSCHSSDYWDDCNRNYRDYCNWDCNDNECHSCNRYGSSYMAAADQMYQDMIDYYNIKQTQAIQQIQPTQTYEVVVIPAETSSSSGQNNSSSFSSFNNWPVILIISISAFILLIIILIILLVARR